MYAEVENHTTGESGFVYALSSQTIGFDDTVFATTIPLNEGDQLTWTTSNDDSVQNPKAGVAQVDYGNLLSSFTTDVSRSANQESTGFDLGSTLTFNLAGSLTDTDGSESLSYTFSGYTSGTSFSAGTDNGDGTWTVLGSQVSGLTMTLSDTDDTDFTLTILAENRDVDPDTGDVDILSKTLSLDIVVNDAPTTIEGPQDMGVLSSSVTGFEDSSIDLQLGTVIGSDNDELVSDIIISGVPTGASLSAGIDNGDGTWTVSVLELPNISITPATDDNSNIQLTTSVDFSQDGVVETFTGAVDVEVFSVVDDFSFVATLSHNGTSIDSDGNVSGGSGVGTGNGNKVTQADDGTYSILVYSDGLTQTLGNPYGFVDGTVTVTLTSLTNDTIVVLDNDDIFNDNIGDGGWQLDINGEQTLASPFGTANTGANVWSIGNAHVINHTTGEEGNAYRLFMSGNSEVIYASTIALQEGDSISWTTSQSSAVQDPIYPVGTVDYSELLANLDSTIGFAEGSTLQLDFTEAFDDMDGSESILSYTMSGYTAGTTFSAGTNNLDGTWTVYADDIAGLTMTLPSGDDSDFTLNILAVSQDVDADSTMSDTAAQTASIDVVVLPAPAEIDGLTDISVLSGTVTGTEDSSIPLNLDTPVAVDSDESISDVTISGVPTGASLSAGTNNGDGSWTVPIASVANLSFTPAPNDNNDVTLNTSVTLSLKMV